MSFLASRTGPRAAVSEVAEVGLKAFAVLAKRTPFDASKPASTKAILGAVDKVNEFLGELKTLELYSDWVPSRADPVADIALAADSAFASSKKNDDNAAGKALADDAAAYWTSSSGKNHHWGVKFPSRSAVSSVAVVFKKDSLPEKVEVQIDEGTGSKEEYRTVAEYKGSKEVTERLAVAIKGGAVSGRALKLVFTGLATDNSNNCVAVQRVTATALRPKESFSSASEALALLQGWFDSIATAAGASADAQEAAIRGLLSIARATGSQNALLRATHHLLSAPQHKLAPATAAVGASVLAALQDAVSSERTLQNAKEYSTFSTGAGGAGGAGGGGAAFGEVVGAKFDPSSSSPSSFTYSNDDKTIYVNGYDNCHAIVNVGPFTEGTASWTFKLDEDTTSQCSCFGAAVKPVTSSNYEYSDSLYMYRAFNGNGYSRGSCSRYGSGDADRVKKGDTIRFDLDFNEADGVIKVTINDNARGVIFTNLKGQEIYPAVAFYSSGRQVSLVSVECSGAVARASGLSIKGGAASAAAAAPAAGGAAAFTGSTLGVTTTLALADLPEESVSVGHGSLGKRGDLGFGESADDRKAKLGGKACMGAIAMHPPAATSAASASAPAAAGAAGAASGSGSSEPAASSSSSSSSSSSADAAAAAPAAGGAAASAAAAGGAGDDDADAAAAAAKAAILSAVSEQTRTTFAATGTAVYWLGRGYETITGSVALADSATADLRGSPDASPVYFELYGTSDASAAPRLLWRSSPFHAAKAPAQAFTVRVLGCDTLRLVTRCVAGNKGAHALWVDLSLTSVTDWACGGWRNDRGAFTDALTGAPRGGEATLPPPHLLGLIAPAAGAAASALGGAASGAGAAAAATPAASAEWLSTSHGLAQGLLTYSGLLAQEHLRGMRRPAPPAAGDATTASIDLEAPFALEPSLAAINTLDGLLKHLAGPGYKAVASASGGLPGLDVPALAAAAAAVVRCAAANLRRVTVAGVSPAATGLATAASKDSASAGAASGGKKNNNNNNSASSDDSGKPKLTLASAVTASVAGLSRLSEWGGKAAGHKIADGPVTPTSAASSPLPAVAAHPLVQDAVWDFVDLTRSFVALDGSSEGEKNAFLKTLASGAGTVEVTLNWPCEELDGDGAFMALEAVLLQLQLAAQGAGWRCKLLGRWPAKAFLVIEVPGGDAGGVADFIETTLPETLASVDLAEWWSGGNDGLPLKLERSATWARTARMGYEPGIGAVRVYPGYVASFDDVVAGLNAFLPKA